MKLLSSFCILLLSIFVAHSIGFAVNPEKPLKFLVLQRSDILEDEVAVPTEANQPDSENTVTEGDDAAVEVATEVIEIVTESVVAPVEEEKPKLWNPADGWKELDFPVIPVEEANASNTKISQDQPTYDYSNVNITRGTITGRAACQCGRPKARIVNGDLARINDIPWTAALVRNGFFGFGASKKPYCGGTLINSQYIATASHCVDGMFANGIKVWLNEEDYLIDTESSGPRQEYLVDEIIMHPEYSRRTVDNDIALLKLEKVVPIDGNPTTFLTPACLPANNDNDFSDIVGTVAGWGLTTEGGSLSNALRKVDVPIITNAKCNSNETKYDGKITDNMLCAGFDEGGKDACQGDSGGPLTIDNTGRNTLVGIVSWGYGCSQPAAPGVYSRVARYTQWILENTKDATWCAN